MRNADQWQPTKFVLARGHLRGSRDVRELAAGSRLSADLIAAHYDRAFREHARGRMLDMGCGKVPFYGAYRSYVKEVECVDWSNSPHGVQHLDKECDLSGRIPYPDASFDTILLSDVLEHLPEPSNCWREMERLLVPGGKVLVNVPFYYWIHEAPYDFYRYTEFALRRFAEQSGFTVLELTPYGAAAEITADIVAKLLVSARLSPAAVFVQWLALSFGRTGLGKRISTKTGAQFPFGYVMVAEKQQA